MVQEFGGGGYYLEVMRHPAESAKERAEVYDNQVRCNAEILRMGREVGDQGDCHERCAFFERRMRRRMTC